jgi:hypothetical protein
MVMESEGSTQQKGDHTGMFIVILFISGAYIEFYIFPPNSENVSCKAYKTVVSCAAGMPRTQINIMKLNITNNTKEGQSLTSMSKGTGNWGRKILRRWADLTPVPSLVPEITSPIQVQGLELLWGKH